MPRWRSNIGRNTSSAKRVRLRRNNKSAQERDVRLLLDSERHVYQRAQESSIDRRVRLSLHRERHFIQRKTKTLQIHLRKDRIRHRNLRNIIQNNSKTQNINRWSNKEYSTIDYRNDPAISIGSPTIVCQYCSALKWKDESRGICYSNSMIKLDDI